MTQHTWDAIVIGASAAGLSAAQALGRSLRKTLVIDAGQPRNRFAAQMHNTLGHDGKTPAELAAIGRAEAEKYGVEFRSGSVQSVTEVPGGIRVTLEPADGAVGTDGIDAAGVSGESYKARALIVASGVIDTPPDIPGLAQRWGQSVLHCPYCHGWEHRGGKIAVVTTSPMGMHQAKLLRQWSDDVTVFSAGIGELDEVSARELAARNVRVIPTQVARLEGEGGQVSAVVTVDGESYPVDAVFTMSAMTPRDEFLSSLALARADQMFGSFIEVDAMGKTSHPRVWAAGNVVLPAATVPMVMGAGTMAGAAANMALIEEDYAQAVAAADIASVAAAAGDAAAVEPAVFWERHYGTAGPVWSGRVNATLASVLDDLAPGRALDLGCGEGGDVIWLAQRGWQATGVDISSTAIGRATTAARDAGLGADRARFVAADLSALPESELADMGLADMDLVSASFFQSPVELDGAAILRVAAKLVAPGGHLVLVSHAGAPSWAGPESGHLHDFPTPEGQVAALELDPALWETLRVEVVGRDIVAPDGSPATIDDALVVVRRR